MGIGDVKNNGFREHAKIMAIVTNDSLIALFLHNDALVMTTRWSFYFLYLPDNLVY